MADYSDVPGMQDTLEKILGRPLSPEAQQALTPQGQKDLAASTNSEGTPFYLQSDDAQANPPPPKDEAPDQDQSDESDEEEDQKSAPAARDDESDEDSEDSGDREPASSDDEETDEEKLREEALAEREKPQDVDQAGPAVLDFGSPEQNANMLQKALDQRDSNLANAQIARGLDQLAGGIGKLKPDYSNSDYARQTANQPLQDMAMKQQQEAQDPKSGISQGMRNYMKQLGVPVSDGATAAQIGQVLPMVFKNMQAKQAQAAKSQDLAQKLAEQQALAKYRNDSLALHRQELNQSKEQARQDKQSKADTDRLDKMSKAVTAEVASGRSAFGQAARNAQSIQNAQALLSGEIDPNQLDNRQVFELTRTLDRVLSQAGGTVAGTEHLTPDTARSRLAKVMEYITNKRQGAQAGSFIKTFSDTLNRESKLANQQIARTQKSMLSSYKDLQQKYPDRFNDILALHGITPDVLDTSAMDQGASSTGNNSPAPKGGGIVPSPDQQAQARAEIAKRLKSKQGQQ